MYYTCFISWFCVLMFKIVFTIFAKQQKEQKKKTSWCPQTCISFPLLPLLFFDAAVWGTLNTYLVKVFSRETSRKKKLQQQYLSHIFFPHIELVIVTIQIIKTSMRETPFVTLKIIIVVFFSFLMWQKRCPYVRWNDNDESVILEQFKVKAS